MSRLERGDLLPEVTVPLPGPETRRLAAELSRFEAPGINTLVGGLPMMVWAEALGSNVLDVEGNRYLDLTAGFGVVAVGHRHPAVLEAIDTACQRLLHGLGDVAAHPSRIELASKLCALAPMSDARVYFAISGADAVEIAVKTAMLATGRSGVIAFEPAYHGTTLGALALTSRPEFRTPFVARLAGAVQRLRFGCAPSELAGLLERQPDVACCVVEPVAGREGVLLPPDGWLEGLATVCREHDVLLVADEIFTGFGRTGDWFASQDAKPDLVCCGKALGGGLPIAAVLGSAQLMAHWAHGGEALHTATFVAHPLATAAGCAVLDVLEADRLPQRAARLGEWIAGPEGGLLGLIGGRGGLGSVRDVRGMGLLWALEADSATRAHRWAEGLLRQGVIALAGGADGRTLQLTPPLVITDQQLQHALHAVRRVIEACDG